MPHRRRSDLQLRHVLHQILNFIPVPPRLLRESHLQLLFMGRFHFRSLLQYHPSYRRNLPVYAHRLELGRW